MQTKFFRGCWGVGGNCFTVYLFANLMIIIHIVFYFSLLNSIRFTIAHKSRTVGIKVDRLMQAGPLNCPILTAGL